MLIISSRMEIAIDCALPFEHVLTAHYLVRNKYSRTLIGRRKCGNPSTDATQFCDYGPVYRIAVVYKLVIYNYLCSFQKDSLSWLKKDTFEKPQQR